MNMRLAYLLFFFSLIVAFYLGVYKPKEEPADFREVPVVPTPESPKAAAPKQTSAVRVAKDRPRREPASETEALTLDEFRKKYGDHLKLDRSRTGEVVGILAKTDRLDAWEKNQRADSAFHPRNYDQVLSRAEAVLQDAREILQLDPQFPLASPQVSQTDFSAQVTFAETHGGVPLSQGQVSVLFGPEGELRSLESDYLQGVRVKNRLPAAAISPGRTILWVDRRSERGAETRYAREVRDSGIQTIRDAESGEIIYRRNRRIH